MIIYEIPLIFILLLVLGGLGIIGESSKGLPMVTAIIVAITEVISLAIVIYKNYEDENRSEFKGRWFLVYFITIVKSVILCATTYFFFKVPADMIANGGGFSFTSAIVYIFLAGPIYVMCVVSIWAMEIAAWDVKKGEERSGMFFWAVIMLLASIALFFVAQFVLPGMFL